jgi:signal transduction histidine kinase
MWLEKNDWDTFINYEEKTDTILNKFKIKAICSYCLDAYGASEIIDIVNSHRYVITEKEGAWIVTENLHSRNLEELLISRNQLSRLFKYVESKRELEKRGTGKEIHDEIAHMLISMKWRLNSLDKTLKTVEDTSSEDINILIQNLDKVYEKTIKLITELLPSVLNHFGFGAALEWQISDFEERTGIKCKMNVTPERIPLNWDNSTVLFRISERLLANVAEHAQATEVKIELNLKEDSIVLKIMDNGIGITKEQVNDSESYGLLEVKESIKLLGGEIDIYGFPDKGTQIKICIKSDKENNKQR